MLFEYFLLNAGEGRFKVLSAAEDISKQGNPMLVLKIQLTDAQNQQTTITEYLTTKLLFKARTLLRAGGMDIPHGVNSIEWGVLDFEGKTGRCEIGIDARAGDFANKNFIKTYLEPLAGAEATQSAAPPPPPAPPCEGHEAQAMADKWFDKE